MSESRKLAVIAAAATVWMLSGLCWADWRDAEYYGAIDVGRIAARAARVVVGGMP